MKESQVQLPQELHISSVSALHQELKAVLESSGDVEINGSQVERADTASLQLLASLQMSLQQVDKKIIWVEPSDTLVSTAKLLDLNGLLGLA